MDRSAFIESNRTALIRIVDALMTMAGLGEGGAGLLLPRAIGRAVWRVLYPAEAAVRRLIVIAACGLTVKPPRPRVFPKNLGHGQRSGERVSFQLVDPRPRLDIGPRYTSSKSIPRIFGFGAAPLVPLFPSQPVIAPDAPLADEIADPRRLGRRLAAIKMALEDLPRQARRLKRWQVRRDRMTSPKFQSPLRPGPPPGHREEPEEEVDLLLIRCHTLARHALSEDTS